MLVLTRKVGDVIAIGDDIKIMVMSIKGKQVRLGIEADKSTVVHREEIYQKIKKENAQAAKSSTSGINQAQDLLKKEDVNRPANKKILIKKKSES